MTSVMSHDVLFDPSVVKWIKKSARRVHYKSRRKVDIEDAEQELYEASLRALEAQKGDRDPVHVVCNKVWSHASYLIRESYTKINLNTVYSDSLDHYEDPSGDHEDQVETKLTVDSIEEVLWQRREDAPKFRMGYVWVKMARDGQDLKSIARYLGVTYPNMRKIVERVRKDLMKTDLWGGEV